MRLDRALSARRGKGAQPPKSRLGVVLRNCSPEQRSTSGELMSELLQALSLHLVGDGMQLSC